MCGSRIAGRVWTVMALVGVLIPLGAASLCAQQQAIDPTWLSFNAAARTAQLQLIAGLTGLNGAIDFRNHDGMLPHSAEIITPRTPLPVQPVAPAIPRAFTLRLDEGLVSEATDTMRFTAQPAGEYLIFCGVPGHGAAGMWIRFQVSATAKTPALLLAAAQGK